MSTQSLATQASATPAAVKSDAGQSGSGISALKIMNYTILVLLTLVFVGPLFFILMNSFKGRFFISSSPFALPIGDYFVGLTNYTSGLAVTNFFNAMVWSFVITIGSVTVIRGRGLRTDPRLSKIEIIGDAKGASPIELPNIRK